MKAMLFDKIKRGDRVTIVTRFGKEMTGRAVMLGPAGWILDMGGPHGRPMFASPGNVTRINKAKVPQPRRRPGRRSGGTRRDDAQKVRDQFVMGFEGGSNYWLSAAKLVRSDNEPTENPWYACPEVFEGSFAIKLVYDEKYEGDGAGLKVITDVDVRCGLDVMAANYPKQFAAVKNGTDDADTADAFIQCALFGRVAYG
jgi:hypothetical protein